MGGWAFSWGEKTWGRGGVPGGITNEPSCFGDGRWGVGVSRGWEGTGKSGVQGELRELQELQALRMGQEELQVLLENSGFRCWEHPSDSQRPAAGRAQPSCLKIKQDKIKKKKSKGKLQCLDKITKETPELR